jgi:hypothetical protein
MTSRQRDLLFLCLISAIITTVPVLSSGNGTGAGGSQAVSQKQNLSASEESPPSNLRPLLARPQSEMRLVIQRYNADRATLNGNYDGGGFGRGGSRVAVISFSTGRIARLKRFDMSWQMALAQLDAKKLSPSAQTDLENLNAAIQANMKQLDADAETLARLMPLVPFAPAIIQLNEARIKLEDVQSEKAAGEMTGVAKQIKMVQAQLEAGLGSDPSTSAVLRVDKDSALRAAEAVDRLRDSARSWYNFYYGYDPIFTWWMEVPNKQVDTALQAYSVFLRDKTAAADFKVATAPAQFTTIPAAPEPALNEVPDLGEIIALPQDEMRDIVRKFIGAGGGGRGGRGAESAGTRGVAYYKGWLTALKTLDFDKLSRNAQVDYLAIRKMCEIKIAQAAVKPQTEIPRKPDNSGISGAARGRVGLISDLENELIPYTIEELIAIAEMEFAWCDEEMKKAAREMGYGDDWKSALERVKEMHVPPGGQPAVIRGLLLEAINFLRAHDLITVPQIASESLHMGMMSPQQQLVNPFFTGGAQISVSYPTNTMEHGAKLQSMRGNSTPLSHATAFHEMIPGHNFVGYMGSRFSGYRANLGGTSFYGEGWPLYWEMLMYELGFHDTPEKRVGALFWRMHRCARIIFSLKFHMGEWSPQECINFLVDRVDFERDNAAGEVRRSFQGGYGPLYQASYLLGGIQLRALRREVVDTGRMTNKAFHDEVMRQGSMPIALLRLALNQRKLSRNMSVDWKFYGENPGRPGRKDP